MRLVAWNCNQGLARDLPAVREHGADVAVLSEVPATPPPDSLFDTQPSWLWVDDGVPSHGLALAGLTSQLAPLLPRPSSGTLSAAADHESGIGILGICARKPTGKYAPESFATIEAHADWLTSKPCVIAGDLNLAPDGIEDRQSGACKRLFETLADMGYTSVYHHVTGEAFGAETKSTYFDHRHEEKGFFIDHCFVHRDLLPKVLNFEVGSYDRWVGRQGELAGHSDHAPLTLDLQV